MVVDHLCLVHFKDFITSDYFKKKFSALALEGKHFLDWVNEVDFLATMSIYKIMKNKVESRPNFLERSMLSSTLDQALN